MMSSTPIPNSAPNTSVSNPPINSGYSESKPAACAGCKRTGLNLLVCDDCASPSEVSSGGGNWKQRYCADCMIGKKVRVFWPLDEQWYVGVVQRYDHNSGEHLLTYPDGDTEWVKIGDSPSNIAAAQADMLAASQSNHTPPQKQHKHSPNAQSGGPLPVTPGAGGRSSMGEMPSSTSQGQQDQMMEYSMQQSRSGHHYDNTKQQQSYDRSQSLQKLHASQKEHLSAISNNRIQSQEHASNLGNSSPDSQTKQHHGRPHGPGTSQSHGHMHGQTNKQLSTSGNNPQSSPPSMPSDAQSYSHGYSSSASHPVGNGGDWHSNVSQGAPVQPTSPNQQNIAPGSQRSSQQHQSHTSQSEGTHVNSMPSYMPGPHNHSMSGPPQMGYHHGGMQQQPMHPYGPSPGGPPQPYLLPRPYMYHPGGVGGGMMQTQDLHVKDENNPAESGNSNGLPKRKSGPKTWTKEEDAILLNMVQSMRMPMKWSIVAQSMPDRTGKQCRERYVNHLNPRLKNAEWSPNEDATIFHLYNSVGSQWAKMSKMIPGRTDNGIKNRFHNLRRQLEREDEHRLRLSKPEDFPDEIHLTRIRNGMPEGLKGKNDQLWDMHKGLGILAAQSVIGAGIARNAGKYGPFHVVGIDGEQCARCGLLVPSVQCGTEICKKTKWCQSCTRIPPHVSGNLLRECLNLRKCQDANKAKTMEEWGSNFGTIGDENPETTSQTDNLIKMEGNVPPIKMEEALTSSAINEDEILSNAVVEM